MIRDLARTVEQALSRVGIGLIAAYQVLLSPLLGPTCRFHPSCSCYAREAIELHGLWAGLALAARRIGRCHPWNRGGVDPVPLPPDRSAGRPS